MKKCGDLKVMPHIDVVMMGLYMEEAIQAYAQR